MALNYGCSRICGHTVNLYIVEKMQPKLWLWHRCRDLKICYIVSSIAVADGS